MAKYLSIADGGRTDTQGFMQYVDDMTGSAEVLSGFNVSQQDTPNVGVKVAAGSAMIPSGNGYSYAVFMDSAENITLDTADGSNPRIDAIVAYVDLSLVQNSTPNNQDALKLAKVTGTPAGSPSAPNAATIISAIGSGKPYIVLANPRVNAGATTVTNANITDTRRRLRSVVQQRWYEFTDTATGSTTIPLDDTLPTSTEGTEFMTATFTPLKPNSTIIAEAVISLSNATGSQTGIAAMYVDSETVARSANGVFSTAGLYQIVLNTSVTTPSTSPTSAMTFRVRAGSTSGAVRFNGVSGARIFGTNTKSWIKVTELNA